MIDTFPTTTQGNFNPGKVLVFMVLVTFVAFGLYQAFTLVTAKTYPPGTLQRPNEKALGDIERALEKSNEAIKKGLKGAHTDHYMTRCGITIARLLEPDKIFTSPSSLAFGWYVEKALRQMNNLPECQNVSQELASEFGRPVDITEVMFFVVTTPEGRGITAYPVPLVTMNAWLTQWGYTMQVYPVIRPVVPGVWPSFQ